MESFVTTFTSMTKSVISIACEMYVYAVKCLFVVMYTLTRQSSGVIPRNTFIMAALAQMPIRTVIQAMSTTATREIFFETLDSLDIFGIGKLAKRVTCFIGINGQTTVKPREFSLRNLNIDEPEPIQNQSNKSDRTFNTFQTNQAQDRLSFDDVQCANESHDQVSSLREESQMKDKNRLQKYALDERDENGSFYVKAIIPKKRFSSPIEKSLKDRDPTMNTFQRTSNILPNELKVTNSWEKRHGLPSDNEENTNEEMVILKEASIIQRSYLRNADGPLPWLWLHDEGQ